MTDIFSIMAKVGAGNCHLIVSNLYKTGHGDPQPGMVTRITGPGDPHKSRPAAYAKTEATRASMKSPATGHGVAGGSHRY